MKIRVYLSMVVWILSLIFIGSIIGSLTKDGTGSWYINLQRSSLTPPSYSFGIVWSILYGMIGISGYMIWGVRNVEGINFIKILYIVNLIANWSWTPLFFYYRQIDAAFICIVFLILLVFLLIIKSYKKLKYVSLLLIPYFLWLIFAAYLNFYIWQNN